MGDSRGPAAQDGRRADRLELRVPTTATQLPGLDERQVKRQVKRL